MGRPKDHPGLLYLAPLLPDFFAFFLRQRRQKSLEVRIRLCRLSPVELNRVAQHQSGGQGGSAVILADKEQVQR